LAAALASADFSALAASFLDASLTAAPVTDATFLRLIPVSLSIMVSVLSSSPRDSGLKNQLYVKYAEYLWLLHESG
jgi:hypothetical protein